MIVTRFIFILSILATHSFASFSILDYNVRDIEPAEDVELQALQRIVGFFDPDIVTFQEAKGQSDITNFLNANPAYEGYRSAAQTIPTGLQLTDTIEASDHLPIFAVFTLPGDFNDDNVWNADDIDLLVLRSTQSSWKRSG